jgi:hypothetical protein
MYVLREEEEEEKKRIHLIDGGRIIDLKEEGEEEE